MGLTSGFAAAYQLGADYPFNDDDEYVYLSLTQRMLINGTVQCSQVVHIGTRSPAPYQNEKRRQERISGITYSIPDLWFY